MKQNLPVVSIVTVSFNQAAFLERALLSVLDQDYPAIEYIVLDGGSKDGSRGILEKYSSRFAYWRSEPDRGAAAALNEGFALASGEYFAYLNSDDCLLPGAVAAWGEGFRVRPDAGVVYGDVAIIDADDRPSNLGNGRKVSLFKASFPGGLRRMAAGGFVIPQQASCWRRQVHACVGGFCELNKTCWDGEFFADAAMAGVQFHLIRRTLAQFRVHQQSITGTGKHAEARTRDYQRIAAKWRSAGVRINAFEGHWHRFCGRAMRTFRYVTERS